MDYFKVCGTVQFQRNMLSVDGGICLRLRVSTRMWLECG